MPIDRIHHTGTRAFKPKVSASEPKKQGERTLRVPEDTVGESKTVLGSRLLGYVGRHIFAVPQFLSKASRFVGATLFSGLSAALQLTAGSLGLVGVAGSGIAGAMSVCQGVKEDDPVKVMDGTSDISRAAFTGILTAPHFWDLSQHATSLATWTTGIGYAQGVIGGVTGAIKVHQGIKTDDRQRRIEGYLEMGMAAAGVAMVAGAMTPLAIGAYGVMTAARFGVVNHQAIKDGWKRLKHDTVELWHSIRRADEDEVDEPAKPKAENPPKTQALSESYRVRAQQKADYIDKPYKLDPAYLATVIR